MGEVVDATKEGSFNKVALRVVFALSPGYAHLPDGLKFVYAIVALLSEGKYDVIISALNRLIEMENLRPLKSELPAVWSDISNAMRGFKDHALHMLVLDEVLGLELSNFSRHQTETGNRRRPSSDHGNVQRLTVPSNGSGR